MRVPYNVNTERFSNGVWIARGTKVSDIPAHQHKMIGWGATREEAIANLRENVLRTRLQYERARLFASGDWTGTETATILI